ncbi:hypothetical protein [Nocardia sp. NPDC057227]
MPDAAPALSGERGIATVDGRGVRSRPAAGERLPRAARPGG